VGGKYAHIGGTEMSDSPKPKRKKTPVSTLTWDKRACEGFDTLRQLVIDVSMIDNSTGMVRKLPVLIATAKELLKDTLGGDHRKDGFVAMLNRSWSDACREAWGK
jgi:hypothetical protein